MQIRRERVGGLRRISHLEHLEHTSVSVKPRSLHPTLLAPSEVVARSRVSARALTNARHILPPKDARRTRSKVNQMTLESYAASR